MKLLNLITYILLPIMISNNSIYTMEDNYNKINKNDYLIGLNDKEKLEKITQLNDLQKELEKKKGEIIQYLAKNKTKMPERYQKNENNYFYDLIENALYDGNYNIHSEILTIKKLFFDKLVEFGYNISKCTEELCILVDVISIESSFLYYMEYTNKIDQKANEFFGNNSLEEVVQHYYDILNKKYNNNRAEKNDFAEIIWGMVNNKYDNKIGANILNAMHNIGNRLYTEKFLFGCLPLICDYFVLKDQIKKLQDELEKYRIK